MIWSFIYLCNFVSFVYEFLNFIFTIDILTCVKDIDLTIENLQRYKIINLKFENSYELKWYERKKN